MHPLVPVAVAGAGEFQVQLVGGLRNRLAQELFRLGQHAAELAIPGEYVPGRAVRDGPPHAGGRRGQSVASSAMRLASSDSADQAGSTAKSNNTQAGRRFMGGISRQVVADRSPARRRVNSDKCLFFFITVVMLARKNSLSLFIRCRMLGRQRI